MDLLVSVNWIALFVLIIALLMFKFLNYMAYKINWTYRSALKEAFSR